METIDNVRNSDRPRCRLNIVFEPITVFNIHYLVRIATGIAFLWHASSSFLICGKLFPKVSILC